LTCVDALFSKLFRLTRRALIAKRSFFLIEKMTCVDLPFESLTGSPKQVRIFCSEMLMWLNQYHYLFGTTQTLEILPQVRGLGWDLVKSVCILEMRAEETDKFYSLFAARP
jgi:hypothetical protein